MPTHRYNLLSSPLLSSLLSSSFLDGEITLEHSRHMASRGAEAGHAVLRFKLSVASLANYLLALSPAPLLTTPFRLFLPY